jgi:hypothetical protein
VWFVARAARRPRGRRRLERWQTLLAAGLTAAAAIATAFIVASANRAANDGSSARAEPATVIIRSVTLVSSAALRIEGAATGFTSPHDVYVVARSDEDQAAASGGASASASNAVARWLAAGPADWLSDTSWQIDFPLPPNVPLPLSFIAVVEEITRPGIATNCPPPGSCAPWSPEEALERLSARGPEDRRHSDEFIGP